EDGLEVSLALEAFGINLVDGLGTRRACGEPAAAGDDLQTVDRGVVSRGARQLGDDRFTSEVRGLHRLRREALKSRFLLGRRRGVDPRIICRAEFGRQRVIMLPRVLAGPCGDLGREQVHDRAVLVGRPYTAVLPQEARPGAFLAAKATGAVIEAR